MIAFKVRIRVKNRASKVLRLTNSIQGRNDRGEGPGEGELPTSDEPHIARRHHSPLRKP